MSETIHTTQVTLLEILLNFLPVAKSFEKSDKSIKPKVVNIPKASYDFINSRIAIMGNDVTIQNQRFFIQVTSNEVLSEKTGEIKTLYSLWFNYPIPQSVVAADTLVLSNNESV